MFNRHFWIGFILGGVAVPILLVGGLIGGLYLFQDTFRARATENLKPPPIPMSTQASYDWELEDVDGNPYDLAETKGKVTFLTIWDPGCGACKSELPVLKELYAKTKDEIAFVTVSKQGGDELDEVIDKFGIEFPVYVSKGESPDAFPTNAVPYSFVVDRGGMIAYQHKGAANWNDEKTIEFFRRLNQEG